MTGSLALIRLRPDMQVLTRWAVEKGYLPKRGDADLGYALHAALRSVMGELAPAPFFLRSKDNGEYELLGYSASTSEDLDIAARLPPSGDGNAAAALALPSFEARDMPVKWRVGGKWSFETRVRPVVRSRAAHADKPGGRGTGHELDYAVWVSECAAQRGERPPPKEAAYLEWLGREMARNGAAQLIEARPVAIRRSRVLRRTQGTDRKSKFLEGPDVWFHGRLRVDDGAAFAALLRRGLGRHRAFGFGCILLAPPGAFL